MNKARDVTVCRREYGGSFPHINRFAWGGNSDFRLFNHNGNRCAANVFAAAHSDHKRVVPCVDGGCDAAPCVGNQRVGDNCAVQLFDNRGAGIVDRLAVIHPPGHADTADLYGDFVGDGHGGCLGGSGVFAVYSVGAGGDGDNRVLFCPRRDGEFAVCNRLRGSAPDLIGQRDILRDALLKGRVVRVLHRTGHNDIFPRNLIGGNGQGDLRRGGVHGDAGINIRRGIVICGVAGCKGHRESPGCRRLCVPAGPVPASGNGGTPVGVCRCTAR